MNNMTKILRLFFLKMVLFLSVLEAATVDDDLSSARLSRASILNAGGKSVSFIVKSNLIPVLSGQEKTEVYPAEGHKFYIYDADRSVSVELPSLIINNTKKEAAYLALAQERSYHLKPGETLDYTLGTFSYITGISLLGAEPSSTISWGANGDMLDVTLCAALESKPANTTFVTTPKDIERHERLYRKHFMPDSKERGRRVWDDFLAQGSGVTGVKRKEEVIISLTSYPARFETTWLAIESLLRQEEKPDRVVLNLFEGEFPGRVLPWFIRKQMERGLEINWCPENLKVYLKVIPTIQKFPEAAVVAFDDDVIYPYDRLHNLMEGYRRFPGCIIAQNVRVIRKYEDFILPVPYWDFTGWRPTSAGIFEPQVGIVPEGVFGIITPPHAYHPGFLARKDLFFDLCPKDDDLWHYVMGIINGREFIKIPILMQPIINIEGTQEIETSLWKSNFANRSQNLTDYFHKIFNHFKLGPLLGARGCVRDSIEFKKGVALSKLLFNKMLEFTKIEEDLYFPIDTLDGFAFPEPHGMWTTAKKASIKNIGVGEAKYLRYYFECVPFLPRSSSVIKADVKSDGDEDLGSITFTPGHAPAIEFFMCSELDRKVNFHFSETFKPLEYDEKSNDFRDLGLCFQRFGCFDIDYKIKSIKTNRREFSRNLCLLLDAGFSGLEEEGVWMSNEGHFQICLGSTGSPVTLSMYGYPFLNEYNKSIALEIYAKDDKLYNGLFRLGDAISDKTEFTFTPSSQVTTFKVVVTGAASPKSLGISEDARTLGFFLRRLDVSS
jgi:hypothetical protein